jgi:DnaJ-class molecular chaperone
MLRDLSTDPYVILGVNRNYSIDDIRKVYKRKCYIYHPDQHKDLKKKQIYENKFEILQHAYEQILLEKSQQNNSKKYDISSSRKMLQPLTHESLFPSNGFKNIFSNFNKIFSDNLTSELQNLERDVNNTNSHFYSKTVKHVTSNGINITKVTENNNGDVKTYEMYNTPTNDSPNIHLLD